MTSGVEEILKSSRGCPDQRSVLAFITCFLLSSPTARCKQHGGLMKRLTGSTRASGSAMLAACPLGF
jgi:hypothetical protein